MAIDQRTRVPRGRGPRFILEAVFLVALAAAAGFADLRAPVIAGVMLAGWLLMALFERAAWRERPHYGSGFPPRYYIPAVDLPPAQPLELVVHGYPGAQRDEAPTWIASAALRAEALGEWPVATVEKVEGEAADDRWLVVELPPVPLAAAEDEPAEPVPMPEPEPMARVPLQPGPAPAPASLPRMALYHADPLAEPVPRRRFRRAPVDSDVSVEVPATPSGKRPLPGGSLPGQRA